MPHDGTRDDPESVIQRLTQEIAKKDQEIAKHRKDLTDAQAQLPWLSEACGDDLWDLRKVDVET